MRGREGVAATLRGLLALALLALTLTAGPGVWAQGDPEEGPAEAPAAEATPTPAPATAPGATEAERAPARGSRGVEGSRSRGRRRPGAGSLGETREPIPDVEASISYFGLPVLRRTLVFEGPYRTKGIEGILELPLGASLSPFLLERNILLLYQLGDIENVQVEAERVQGGVALRFHILPRPLVSELNVKGNRLLSNKGIRDLTRLEVGQPFEPADIDRTVAAVRRAYVQQGYSQATVKVTEVAEPEGVAVTLRVREGEPERVASVRFSGVADAEARQLMDVVRIRVGDRFVPDDVEEDRRRLLAYLKDKGHLAARVEMEPQLFANNRRVIRYRIEKGPIIELDFTLIGARAFGPLRGEIYAKTLEILGTDRRTLRWNRRAELVDLLDLENERQFSGGFILEARDTLRAHYQSLGYNDVRVLVRETSVAGSGEKSFLFTIRLGEVIPIIAVRVEGNQAVDDSTLEELFKESMAESAPWGVFTERAFEQAPNLVLNYYRSQGYARAYFPSVGVEMEEGTFGKRAVITAQVVEGARVVVQSIPIEGAEAIPEGALRAALPVKVGEPFNPSRARQGEEAMADLYYAQGYRDVQVSHTRSTTQSGGVMVTYHVDEGAQHTFGQTLYAGNWKTRDGVIEPTLKIPEGETWDPERVADVQRDLMSTGTFRGVEMRPIVGNDAQDDLLVVLHERTLVETAVALGVSLEDWLELSVSASHNNVGGLGHRASLNAEIAGMSRSAGLEDLKSPSLLYARVAASTGSKINLTYSQPRILGSAINSIYSASLFERDFKTNYRIQRNALSWSLARPFDSGVQTYGLLQAERRRPVGGAGIRDCDLAQIWAVDGESRYGTTEGLGFVYTSRSAKTASAGASGSGFLVSGQAEVVQMYTLKGVEESLCDETLSDNLAFFPGVGELAEQFGRVTARASWSQPWADFLRTEVRVNGGYAHPFAGSGGAIPVEKRFYLGGATTVRGFLLDRMGPVVVDRAAFTGLTGMYTALPTGGNAFFSYSLEATLPLSVATESLTGWELGIFHDGGNVYWTGESRETFLAEVAAEYENVDPSGQNPIPGRTADRCDPIGPMIRTAYGAGVRYQTPVGPLRLDLAFNADPRCFEPPWQIHFSIGLF